MDNQHIHAFISQKNRQPNSLTDNFANQQRQKASNGAQMCESSVGDAWKFRESSVNFCGRCVRVPWSSMGDVWEFCERCVRSFLRFFT